MLEYSVSCSSDFPGGSPKLHPFGPSCADLTENPTLLRGIIRAPENIARTLIKTGGRFDDCILALPSLGNGCVFLSPACQGRR
jgi:hypothetical protein